MSEEADGVPMALHVPARVVQKAVKNYVVNDLGLSRASIQEIVNERVTALVAKSLKDGELRALVVAIVGQKIDETMTDKTDRFHTGFDRWARGAVEQAIKDKVMAGLNIEISQP